MELIKWLPLYAAEKEEGAASPDPEAAQAKESGEAPGGSGAQQPPGDAGAQPAEAKPEGEAKPAAEAKPEGETKAPEAEPKPKVETPPWVMPRINKLTAEKRALEEELARIRGSQAQAPEAPQPSTQAPGQRPTAPMSDAEWQQRVAREAALLQLNRDLTSMIGEGNKKYGEQTFQHSIAVLRDGVGGVTQELLEAVLETGEGARVIHELAQNPERAAQITALPPARQGVALAKFLNGLGEPPTVSRAPAPIAPKVKGAGKTAVDLDDPNLSMDDWMKKRATEVQAARANGRYQR